MTRPIRLLPRLALLSVLLALACFGFATPAHAGGVVTNCSDDTDLDNKLTGGVITFNCGTATIPWNLGTKTISADTTIDGGGVITLDGNFGHRLFVVNSGKTLTLQNITLVNGYNPDSAGGAAVANSGHLVMDHVTAHGMVDSAFNGGVIGTTGRVDVTNSTFYENKATNGGAIYGNGAGAVIAIESSTFHDNRATGSGSNGLGGALYLTSSAHLLLEHVEAYGNSARNGGALYVNSGASADITFSPLHDNQASADGGGIYSKGATTVGNSTFSLNHAAYGGGVVNDQGTLTMTDSTLYRNYTSSAGGGGIANQGTMTLTGLTLSENIAAGDACGLENSGTATVLNVTFSGNRSSSGGAIWNLPGGALGLGDATLVGNSATGTGGGIGNSNDPSTDLALINVIVADSPSGGNCDFQKAPSRSEENLSSDTTCNFAAGGGGDSLKLKLGPLETNGGPTLTHRLLPGSPAIDRGTSSLVVSGDQRGVSRPQGGGYDVGAVEFIPCPNGPSKPLVYFPASGAQFTDPHVLLDWVGPDCVKNYSVVVRQGSKTGPIVFSKNKIKPTQVTTTALARNKKYVWQVTACKGTQCASSTWSKFRVN